MQTTQQPNNEQTDSGLAINIDLSSFVKKEGDKVKVVKHGKVAPKLKQAATPHRHSPRRQVSKMDTIRHGLLLVAMVLMGGTSAAAEQDDQLVTLSPEIEAAMGHVEKKSDTRAVGREKVASPKVDLQEVARQNIQPAKLDLQEMVRRNLMKERQKEIQHKAQPKPLDVKKLARDIAKAFPKEPAKEKTDKPKRHVNEELAEVIQEGYHREGDAWAPNDKPAKLDLQELARQTIKQPPAPAGKVDLQKMVRATLAKDAIVNAGVTAMQGGEMRVVIPLVPSNNGAKLFLPEAFRWSGTAKVKMTNPDTDYVMVIRRIGKAYASPEVFLGKLSAVAAIDLGGVNRATGKWWSVGTDITAESGDVITSWKCVRAMVNLPHKAASELALAFGIDMFAPPVETGPNIHAWNAAYKAANIESPEWAIDELIGRPYLMAPEAFDRVPGCRTHVVRAGRACEELGLTDGDFYKSLCKLMKDAETAPVKKWVDPRQQQQQRQKSAAPARQVAALV